MRKRILLNILMIVSLVCFWDISAQAVSIGFITSDSYITVGEEFTIEVWVDGENIEEELIGFGFDVLSSGTCFTYNGYELGNSSLDDFFASGFNDIEATAFPGISDDDIFLATLSFTAIGDGAESVQVYAASTMFSGLIYESSEFAIEAFTNIVVHSASVPEPASVMLLGIGVVGMCLLRKKN